MPTEIEQQEIMLVAVSLEQTNRLAYRLAGRLLT